MKLSPVNDDHLTQLMSWFVNEQQLKNWSGPNFDYPFTAESFKRDLRMDSLTSFALLDEGNQFVAFGQYYLRLNCCHLGRLVVNPSLRGKGIIAQLIQALVESGKQTLAVSSCSLFVLADNKSAITAYQKSGFSMATYPELIPLDNCLYMTM
ncbi:MAG: GNAT family N-acetyltransferase [Colwellia sp.]|nr:GNAT family N-acetyltransferase [Colwellia sp.]